MNSIDPKLNYSLIYASLDFEQNLNTLKRLEDDYGVIIPYLEVKNLSQDMREAFENYIYIDSEESLESKLVKLSKDFGSTIFSYLGPVQGKSILEMLKGCENILVKSINKDRLYQITEGRLKNLIVRIIKVMDKGGILVEYDSYESSHQIEVGVGSLKEARVQDLPIPKYTNYLKINKEDGVMKSIIIDGHNALYRSIFGNDTRRTKRENRFVGGCQGFYFILLKLREFHPEYEIHVIFDGFDSEKIKSYPEYKQGRVKYPQKFIDAFEDNRDWSIKFCEAVGIPVYLSKDKEGGDVIGSLACKMSQDGYSEILIYSKDMDFCQLVSDKIFLYSPKKSFRTHPELIKEQDVLEIFKINDIGKVNWLKALAGDVADNIITVNSFNKLNGVKHIRNRLEDYLKLVNSSDSLFEFEGKLKTDKRFVKFYEENQFYANLAMLTINVALFEGLEIQKFNVDNFNTEAVTTLLDEVSFFRELEILDKNKNIFQGNW